MPIFAQTNSYIMKNKVIRKELGQWMNHAEKPFMVPSGDIERKLLKQPKAPDDVGYVIELTINY